MTTAGAPGATTADTAARICREYTEAARSEAITWTQTGQAPGPGQGPDAKRGHDLDAAAFEYLAGEPGLWHQASFGYRCAVCGQHVTDRGRYESHPEDRESGHGAGCSRFAAELAAWQAERDAWDAQDQD